MGDAGMILAGWQQSADAYMMACYFRLFFFFFFSFDDVDENTEEYSTRKDTDEKRTN